ncbi:hypothetical protein OAF51_04855 [Akkermansiaceae bacterium]|nr:hypothetical protein [Akkermansiaceae bacterium]MDC0305101.1 hypothetical protein [bacterium]
MPKFKLNYATRKGEVSEKTVISSKDYLTAVAEFSEAHPSDIQFIDVYSFLGGDQRVTNPNWEDKKVSLEREQAEAERLAEVELLKKIIIAADTPLQLSFTQLELLLENFSLFPTLERGDEEIYSLREKLYMLSFWNTALQSSLQTRLLSQIASVTSAPQTGDSGSGQPKWAPLAAMAAVSKLGNIETDVDDMADGFLGED